MFPTKILHRWSFSICMLQVVEKTDIWMLFISNLLYVSFCLFEKLVPIQTKTGTFTNITSLELLYKIGVHICLFWVELCGWVGQHKPFDSDCIYFSKRKVDLGRSYMRSSTLLPTLWNTSALMIPLLYSNAGETKL